ncbi:aconitase family protein [Wolbachia endosymbiont of Cruorifilaria tuberocauda]|uniref:aconitase family protein n=1 Tax=Wolbachia endosymbiont of Cruorifilaria tuberocauda TaxID=1812111 RepID=UPI001FE25BBF|nr:aconitase family protein [Wolbachia endosymbiont of Cruorifilaria tuberocauda]
MMIAAGLVARSAVKLGIKSKKPWIKLLLLHGAQVAMDYLEKSGLQKYLNALVFNLVGYSCTTCIGNSSLLGKDVANDIKSKNLTVATVLSGDRNFKGRIHPLAKANCLVSHLLVIIYALAGTVRIDLTKDPICESIDGCGVYLKDL